MSRCSACNEILSPGELQKDNSKTSQPDDLCRLCRHPNWDLGILLNYKTGALEGMRNEAHDVTMNQPMGGLGTMDNIINHIIDTGSISSTDT